MADRTPTTRSSTTAPGIRCLIWLRPLPEEQGRAGDALGVALFVVLLDATQAKEAFRLILPVLQNGTLRHVAPTDLTQHGGCNTLDARLFDPRPAMFCDGRPSDPGCFAHVAGALVRDNESTRGDLRIFTANSAEVALVPLRSQFRFRTFLWLNDRSELGAYVSTARGAILVLGLLDSKCTRPAQQMAAVEDLHVLRVLGVHLRSVDLAEAHRALAVPTQLLNQLLEFLERRLQHLAVVSRRQLMDLARGLTNSNAGRLI